MLNKGNLNKLKYYKTHQVNGSDISRSTSLHSGRKLKQKNKEARMKAKSRKMSRWQKM